MAGLGFLIIFDLFEVLHTRIIVCGLGLNFNILIIGESRNQKLDFGLRETSPVLA
jgi:hypothetical protein